MLGVRGRSVVVLLLLILSLLSSASASPTPPVKIVANVVSTLVKWLWSLKSTAKPGISGITSSRSMMKFESGYTVETVFDGSKMGIEPHSVQVSSNGQILVLDSENSNIYKITTPLSRNSRPKLVAGSFEGYNGHVDGKPRESRLNHPKGLTVDDKGNVYVADTMNMAIRKISDSGVSTIAGGKWGRGGDHVDGPSEDAKFSNDFDVVYLASSCSLLVVDRGNQAIREIQLNDEDCSHHYDTSLNLGIAMLLAAAFFGYMLALLQRRVRAMFSSQDDVDPRNLSPATTTRAMPISPYQRVQKSVRAPLIPPEDENYDYDRQEDGFLGSVGKLFVTTGSSVAQIFGRKRPRHHHQNHQNNFRNYPNNAATNYDWPTQESFMIPDGDEPPPPAIEARPQAKRPFLSKEVEKSRGMYYGNGGDYNGAHHLKKPPPTQQNHHHRQYSAAPSKTIYEKSGDTSEIVFGAVQEQASAVVIKAVDYADPAYNHHNIRPRVNYNYTGY